MKPSVVYFLKVEFEWARMCREHVVENTYNNHSSRVCLSSTNAQPYCLFIWGEQNASVWRF